MTPFPGKACIATGLQVELPFGYYGRVAPRSGNHPLFSKKNLDYRTGCQEFHRRRSWSRGQRLPRRVEGPPLQFRNTRLPGKTSLRIPPLNQIFRLKKAKELPNSSVRRLLTVNTSRSSHWKRLAAELEASDRLAFEEGLQCSKYGTLSLISLYLCVNEPVLHLQLFFCKDTARFDGRHRVTPCGRLITIPASCFLFSFRYPQSLLDPLSQFVPIFVITSSLGNCLVGRQVKSAGNRQNHRETNPEKTRITRG